MEERNMQMESTLEVSAELGIDKVEVSQEEPKYKPDMARIINRILLSGSGLM
jgi:molybdenum cofactor biosynthesis enzyme MoaA